MGDTVSTATAPTSVEPSPIGGTIGPPGVFELIQLERNETSNAQVAPRRQRIDDQYKDLTLKFYSLKDLFDSGTTLRESSYGEPRSALRNMRTVQSQADALRQEWEGSLPREEAAEPVGRTVSSEVQERLRYVRVCSNAVFKPNVD